MNYSIQNPGFLNNLVSSDEAVFSLNSEVNTHNVIRYARSGQGHPQDHYIGNRQVADQVLVWVGLTGNEEVFGPHFLRGNLDTREYLRVVRCNVIQQDFDELPTSKSCNHKRMQEHSKKCNSKCISCHDSEVPEMYKCGWTCFC